MASQRGQNTPPTASQAMKEATKLPTADHGAPMSASATPGRPRAQQVLQLEVVQPAGQAARHPRAALSA